jgi:hypothetical protein
LRLSKKAFLQEDNITLRFVFTSSAFTGVGQPPLLSESSASLSLSSFG